MSKTKPTRPPPQPAETDLPEGWASATMSDVAEVVGGGTPKSTDPENFADNGHPWITPADLSDFEGVLIEHGRRALTDKGLAGCSARLVPAGTVLMSSRAPIGYVAVAANELCTNQGFKSFILADGLDSRFVLYWLRFNRGEIEQMGSGSTFMELSGARCREIPIVFPPLAEQKRIVAKVEELLGRVNAARARLAKLPAILKRFRQSVLAAACSGQLTADWRDGQSSLEPAGALLERIMANRRKRHRAELEAAKPKGGRGPRKPKSLEPSLTSCDLHELPEQWRWVTWDDLTDWITYGFTRPMPHVDHGIPIVTAKNVLDGQIDFTTADHTTPEAFDGLSEKDRPRAGEILVTKDGTLGRAAIVAESRPFCINQSVALLRFGGLSADARYLLYVVWSRLTQDMIEDQAKGAAMRHISITAFGTLPVPLPPTEEQNEIVRRVERLFALADAIEKRISAATARAGRMTQPILARAFRGELVPTEAELGAKEGREYEPASVLLARIQEDRKQQKPTKRRRGDKTMTARSAARRPAKARRPLTDVLVEQKERLTPEKLFELAGFDEDSVDQFYEQLRTLVQEGKIRQVRPNKKDVYLEATET